MCVFFLFGCVCVCLFFFSVACRKKKKKKTGGVQAKAGKGIREDSASFFFFPRLVTYIHTTQKENTGVQVRTNECASATHKITY